MIEKSIDWKINPRTKQCFYFSGGLDHLKHILLRVKQEYVTGNETYRETEYSLLNVSDNHFAVRISFMPVHKFWSNITFCQKNITNWPCRSKHLVRFHGPWTKYNIRLCCPLDVHLNWLLSCKFLFWIVNYNLFFVSCFVHLKRNIKQRSF